MKTSLNMLILTGLFFILLSVIFFGYYCINRDQVIEYTLKTTDIKLTRPEEKDWHLEIAKLNISAPININIDGNNEEQYLTSLQTGVAHLAGSAIPGNIGNIFIFGHSSYYFYDRGSYKYVFKNLNDLSIDDEIIIKSNIGLYKYKVSEKKVVNPDQVEVTGIVKEGQETLSLMTCTPVGTSLQRLIVVATRI